jgi:hypothetical protein
MNADAFLLINLALAFYGVCAIWAHEIDIFRSWKPMDDPETFNECNAVTGESCPLGRTRAALQMQPGSLNQDRVVR